MSFHTAQAETLFSCLQRSYNSFAARRYTRNRENLTSEDLRPAIGFSVLVSASCIRDRNPVSATEIRNPSLALSARLWSKNGHKRKVVCHAFWPGCRSVTGYLAAAVCCAQRPTVETRSSTVSALAARSCSTLAPETLSTPLFLLSDTTLRTCTSPG